MKSNCISSGEKWWGQTSMALTSMETVTGGMVVVGVAWGGGEGARLVLFRSTLFLSPWSPWYNGTGWLGIFFFFYLLLHACRAMLVLFHSIFLSPCILGKGWCLFYSILPIFFFACVLGKRQCLYYSVVFSFCMHIGHAAMLLLFCSAVLLSPCMLGILPIFFFFPHICNGRWNFKTSKWGYAIFSETGFWHQAGTVAPMHNIMFHYR